MLNMEWEIILKMLPTGNLSAQEHFSQNESPQRGLNNLFYPIDLNK